MSEITGKLGGVERAAVAHVSEQVGFDIESSYRHGDIFWRQRVQDFMSGARWIDDYRLLRAIEHRPELLEPSKVLSELTQRADPEKCQAE
jgi:hypothetical protein